MKTIQIKNPSEVVIERTRILFIVIALLFALQSNAQLSVSININANTNRVYETEYRHVHDSRCNHREVVEYYYYPEIEVYFDVQAAVYLYHTSKGWTRSRYLPRHCSHYNIQRGYRVGLDYHGQRPYNHFHDHKMKYKIKKHYYADKHSKGKHKGHKKY
ncbi:hypothetical protein FIA58_019565 [Flavobacterium jejuense]|uniref:Uncharacterized protein n=1 Tax=Flavobacterium jejuense TaxID=1544455 RepID=A0ABX0J100_9FLAO|nr:hypothetical protein [Flavobacterium jejuense]NHN27881.1 hypothetical protein [Flavobacterium jejuense]